MNAMAKKEEQLRVKKNRRSLYSPCESIFENEKEFRSKEGGQNEKQSSSSVEDKFQEHSSDIQCQPVTRVSLSSMPSFCNIKEDIEDYSRFFDNNSLIELVGRDHSEQRETSEQKRCALEFSPEPKTNESKTMRMPSNELGLESDGDSSNTKQLCSFQMSSPRPNRWPGLNDTEYAQGKKEDNPEQQMTLQENNFQSESTISLMTPTLAMSFSPFLTFSEERGNISTDTVLGSLPNDLENNEKEARNTRRIEATKQNTEQSDSKHSKESPSSLTYADSLLLNAAKFRATPLLTNKKKAQSATAKSSGKNKRKNSGPERNRRPQKRYSIDLKSKKISGDDMFGSKCNGRVRLTTNVPREVEALDPITGGKMHSFASCSEAARCMNINRTRMSRTCRAGGGKIGDLVYRYAEMHDPSTSKSDSSESNVPTQIDHTVVAAASALLLL